jgi:hypothetical protein
MALLSLGEGKWRMIRRVLKKKRFQFADTRNMARADKDQFEWLVRYGFFRDAGDGWYEVTQRGKDSADLGFYELGDLSPAPPATPAGRSRTRSRGRP